MASCVRLVRASTVVVAAAVVFIAVMGGPATAQQTTGITLSPTVAQTAAEYSGAGLYEGDAGVVTVSVAANSIFKPSAPLSFEECNLDPTSQADCDQLTMQESGPAGSAAVVPEADGSVSFTMELWILPTGNALTAPDVDDPDNNNPSGFDHGSSVTCNADDPCSIWVGDDPGTWGSNSFVFNSVTLLPNTLALSSSPGTTTALPAPSTTTTLDSAHDNDVGSADDYNYDQFGRSRPHHYRPDWRPGPRVCLPAIVTGWRRHDRGRLAHPFACPPRRGSRALGLSDRHPWGNGVACVVCAAGPATCYRWF